MERLARRNEFNKTDLTAYNADRLGDRGFAVQYGGVKFLGGMAVRIGMEIKDVLKRLQALGLNTSERTLQRYAKDGLVKKPKTKSAGRGYGKTADWPDDTDVQFFTAWQLLHGAKISKEQIAQIRYLAEVGRQAWGKVTNRRDATNKFGVSESSRLFNEAVENEANKMGLDQEIAKLAFAWDMSTGDKRFGQLESIKKSE